MELLIVLVLIGLVVMLLPYILAGALIAIGAVSFVLAFVAMGVNKLWKSVFGR